jgi:hypothetical protein
MSKTKMVSSVASDDEHVRMKIYDGDIPLGEAGGELLKLALASHHRSEETRLLTRLLFEGLQGHYERIEMPWPVRWYQFFRDKRDQQKG